MSRNTLITKKIIKQHAGLDGVKMNNIF